MYAIFGGPEARALRKRRDRGHRGENEREPGRATSGTHEDLQI